MRLVAFLPRKVHQRSRKATLSCTQVLFHKRVRKIHPSHRNTQLGPEVALNPNGFHTETIISTTGLWRGPSCACCHGWTGKPALLRASGGLTLSPQALLERWPQCDSAVSHGQVFLSPKGRTEGKGLNVC